MAEKRPTRIRAMPNDVGAWGEREDRGNADYQTPLKIAGETVDLDKLPKFGGLSLSGKAKAPLLPPGSP